MSVPETQEKQEAFEDFSVDSFLHDMFDDVLIQAMFLDQVLAIIDNGIFIFDSNNRLTVANNAIKEILGYDDKELMGKDLHKLFVELTKGKNRDFVDKMLGTGKKSEITVFSKDREKLHLVVGARGLKNERDEFAGYVLSITNFTEQKNLQLALAEKNKTLSKIANRDALTGLYNRLYFEDTLSQKILESRRYGTNLSLAMMDIDHFKKFNDTFGHLAGDAVLKDLANLLTTNCRASDIPTRYGGEEFALILTGSQLEAAAGAANRLRQIIEENVVPYKEELLSFTVSMGVATYNPLKHKSQEELIDEADAALYEAKEAGRNCVVLSKVKP